MSRDANESAPFLRTLHRGRTAMHAAVETYRYTHTTLAILCRWLGYQGLIQIDSNGQNPIEFAETLGVADAADMLRVVDSAKPSDALASLRCFEDGIHSKMFRSPPQQPPEIQIEQADCRPVQGPSCDSAAACPGTPVRSPHLPLSQAVFSPGWRTAEPFPHRALADVSWSGDGESARASQCTITDDSISSGCPPARASQCTITEDSISSGCLLSLNETMTTPLHGNPMASIFDSSQGVGSPALRSARDLFEDLPDHSHGYQFHTPKRGLADMASLDSLFSSPSHWVMPYHYPTL